MPHTGTASETVRPMDLTRWSDRASREALQFVADSVAELAGFEVAVINIIRAQTMTTVTVSHGRPEVAETLLGANTSMTSIDTELDRAETWGRLRFVSEERLGDDVPIWGWRDQGPPLDAPNAWRPDDLLLGPLYSEAGDLIGLLSVDLPLDGLRPDDQTRKLLAAYTAQAEQAVRSALHRDEIARQVRLTQTARDLVRVASSQPTLEDVLEQSHTPLTEGFGSFGTWIQVFDVHGSVGRANLTDGSSIEIPAELVGVARRAARLLWAKQEAAVVGRSYPPTDVITAEERDGVLAFLEIYEIDSIMFVPLGAGKDTFGILVLGRWADDPYWSPIEAVSALNIGRDLGAAILNARAF